MRRRYSRRMQQPSTRGKVFILCAPSGAGKSTLCKGLLANDPTRFFSVSATTRPQGNGETDGVDYHFISLEQFDAWLAQGNFLEHAHVYGNRYGTVRAPIEAALADGRDVLVDVDHAGMQAIRAALAPEDTVTVFLQPSTDAEKTLDVLRTRLTARGRDDEAAIERRLGKALGMIEEARTLGFNHTLETSGTPEETLDKAESLIAQAHGLLPNHRVIHGSSSKLDPYRGIE